MSGSQVLGRAHRGAVSEHNIAGDVTPRQNTGLGLTADKAEEIRRRHEDEVMALGAEVLAQTRRNNQRRQASVSGRGTSTPVLGAEDSGAEQQQQVTSSAKNSNRLSTGSTLVAPHMSNSSTLSKSASRDSTHERTFEKKSISRAVALHHAQSNRRQ